MFKILPRKGRQYLLTDKIGKMDEKRRYLHLLVVLFILNICVCLGKLWITKTIHGGDSVYYFITLRSLLKDGDIDFENEFKFYQGQQSALTGRAKIGPEPGATEHGPRPTRYPIGTAILWSPFFLFAELVAYVMNYLGFHIPTDGYSFPYVLIVSLSNTLYGFIALLLTFKMLQHFYPLKIAFMATAATWMATSLFWYMTIAPTYSHAASAFSVTLFIFYWYRTSAERSPLQWIALGILAAIMTMVRYQDGVFALLVLFEILGRDRFGLLSYLKGFILFVVAFVLVLTPQMVYNTAAFGYPWATYTLEYGFCYLTSPKILQVLFDSKHGLFSVTPITLLSLVGLFFLASKNRHLAILLLTCFLMHLYIQSSWETYRSGGFGARLLVNSTLIFALGLGGLINFSIEKFKVSSRTLGILLWGFVALNFFKMYLYIQWILRGQ